MHSSMYFVEFSIKQIEKISKALGDGNRLKILGHIAKKGGCGQCSDIQNVVDLAQPSISHHVKIIVEAGLIEPEKEGREIINTRLSRMFWMIIWHSWAT